MPRLLFACLVWPLLAAPALADFPCDEFAAERNAVYDDAGYCFKTKAAIAAFDNSDCEYDDVRDLPLSARDRAKVAGIRREERRNDCPR